MIGLRYHEGPPPGRAGLLSGRGIQPAGVWAGGGTAHSPRRPGDPRGLAVPPRGGGIGAAPRERGDSLLELDDAEALRPGLLLAGFRGLRLAPLVFAAFHGVSLLHRLRERLPARAASGQAACPARVATVAPDVNAPSGRETPDGFFRFPSPADGLRPRVPWAGPPAVAAG